MEIVDGRRMEEEYRVQKLQMYRLALEYVDAIIEFSRLLPEREKYNIASRIECAATSIVVNVAECSKEQSDAEKHHFLGLAIRSYLETMTCCDLIERQEYFPSDDLTSLRERGHDLLIRLSALRKTFKR